MKRKITVPLPLNISTNDLFLYEGYTSYNWKDLHVKFFKKVLITYSGYCMNYSGLIKESHHGYDFQYAEYLNEAERFYHDANNNPENLITLDDENVYLVIHHPWFNYYHWICESVFRLWMVRKRLDKLVLVLPEYYKDADFITGSLRPFNIKDIYYIPHNKNLLVRNVCLPELKPFCDSYSKRNLLAVSSFYKNFVESHLKKRKLFSRLYISRELASRRKIINEIEVCKVVKLYGFEIFNPENFTFLEQVQVFSSVQYLIGMHGSGLTNMLFMNKGISVLELIKNKTNDLDHPSFLFWYMAEALNISYYHQICLDFGVEDYFEGDYEVDTCKLEQNILLMLCRDL